MYADRYGMVLPTYDVSGMLLPVLCRLCGKVYDLAGVNPTSKHEDCDVFKTPCCHRQADTRPWKSLPDYSELTPEGRVKTREHSH